MTRQLLESVGASKLEEERAVDDARFELPCRKRFERHEQAVDHLVTRLDERAMYTELLHQARWAERKIRPSWYRLVKAQLIYLGIGKVPAVRA